MNTSNVTGIVQKDQTQFDEIFDLISGKYALCPGIDSSFYEDKVKVTGYHRDNVRILSQPVVRFESASCLLWHQPCNVFARVGHEMHNVCHECKVEAQRTVQNASRHVLLSPEEKEARMNPSSNFPVCKLSPVSLTEKIRRLKKERRALSEKVKHFTQTSSKWVH